MTPDAAPWPDRIDGTAFERKESCALSMLQPPSSVKTDLVKPGQGAKTALFQAMTPYPAAEHRRFPGDDLMATPF